LITLLALTQVPKMAFRVGFTPGKSRIWTV
jgi:hypothetical protein